MRTVPEGRSCSSSGNRASLPSGLVHSHTTSPSRSSFTSLAAAPAAGFT
jgi:hypothetical protein